MSQNRFEDPGVTIIYAGTGCAIFGVPFIKQKIDFGVSFLVKPQVVRNFGGVILEKLFFRVLILIKFHLFG